MKKIIIAASAMILFACSNNSTSSASSDTVTKVNTETGNVDDGGPNHGMGDTTAAKLTPGDSTGKLEKK